MLILNEVEYPTPRGWENLGISYTPKLQHTTAVRLYAVDEGIKL